LVIYLSNISYAPILGADEIGVGLPQKSLPPLSGIIFPLNRQGELSNSL
jgi:hypothetical protein